MIDDLAIGLLAAAGGFVTALWLLLVWAGDGSSPDDSSGPSLHEPSSDASATVDVEDPFIPLPEDLQTRDEIVAWMTKELPRLIVEHSNPRTP